MSGYRTIAFIGLLWFFGARLEHEVEGAFVSVVIGPFTTRAECEKYRLQAADLVKLADGTLTKCISKGEI